MEPSQRLGRAQPRQGAGSGTGSGVGAGSGAGSGAAVVGAVVAAGVDEPGGLEVEEPAIVVLDVLVAPDFPAADVDFVQGSGITFRLVLIFPGGGNCLTGDPDK